MAEEYRTSVNRPQLTVRTKTTIRRAFLSLNRGQDTRFLDNLTHLQDLNGQIYACAYLIILDKTEEDVKSISNSPIFKALVDKAVGGDSEEDRKRRLALLFQVYITIILIRLYVPEEELSLKEGQRHRKYFGSEDDGEDNLVYGGSY